MLNGSFGIPSTASDGIQEMDVTDDSIRIVGPFRDLTGRVEGMPLLRRLQELSARFRRRRLSPFAHGG